MTTDNQTTDTKTREKNTEKPTITVTLSRTTFIKAWKNFIEDRMAGRKNRTGIKVPLKGKKPQDVDGVEAEAYRPTSGRHPHPETAPIQINMFSFSDNPEFDGGRIAGGFYASFEAMVNEEGLEPQEFDVNSFEDMTQEDKQQELELANELYLGSVWEQVQNIEEIETQRVIIQFRMGDE